MAKTAVSKTANGSSNLSTSAHEKPGTDLPLPALFCLFPSFGLNASPDADPSRPAPPIKRADGKVQLPGCRRGLPAGAAQQTKSW